MKNIKKLALDELEKVAGGWEESQLNEQERSRYHEIFDRLEHMKDTGEGSQDEADELMKRLTEFHLEMDSKYGK